MIFLGVKVDTGHQYSHFQNVRGLQGRPSDSQMDEGNVPIVLLQQHLFLRQVPNRGQLSSPGSAILQQLFRYRYSLLGRLAGFRPLKVNERLGRRAPEWLLL